MDLLDILPSELLCSIVFEWVGNSVDIANFDCSLCNRLMREKYYSILKNSYGFQNICFNLNSENALSHFENWVKFRNTTVRKLTYDGTCDLLPEKFVDNEDVYANLTEMKLIISKKRYDVDLDISVAAILTAAKKLESLYLNGKWNFVGYENTLMADPIQHGISYQALLNCNLRCISFASVQTAGRLSTFLSACCQISKPYTLFVALIYHLWSLYSW